MAHAASGLDLANRRSLIESLPHGGVVAEIGVAEGCLSEVILNTNHPRELWLIDSWRHRDDCGSDPSNVHRTAQLSRYFSVLQRFRSDPRVAVFRGESDWACACFHANSLDWIHIDANHLQLRSDLLGWWPCVKPGGWITGHDYTVAGDHITVKTDVDQFVQERGLELFVTQGKGDVYEKNYPSWAFRRP